MRRRPAPCGCGAAGPHRPGAGLRPLPQLQGGLPDLSSQDSRAAGEAHRAVEGTTPTASRGGPALGVDGKALRVHEAGNWGALLTSSLCPGPAGGPRAAAAHGWRWSMRRGCAQPDLRMLSLQSAACCFRVRDCSVGSACCCATHLCLLPALQVGAGRTSLAARAVGLLSRAGCQIYRRSQQRTRPTQPCQPRPQLQSLAHGRRSSGARLMPTARPPQRQRLSTSSSSSRPARRRGCGAAAGAALAWPTPRSSLL